MDTAWTWELSDHCAKYSFLTESKGLTMREVERIFQLDPEPPVLENMNDYIIEAVRSRELRWFSFFVSVKREPPGFKRDLAAENQESLNCK